MPSGTRILIVDDHRTFVELLAGALDREPDLTTVGFAHGVEQAVTAHAATSPDVVVMDFHLVDGDGITAATQMLAANSATRVIMLTGDPTSDALERAARLGVCAFLPKDGSLSVLLDAIRHARRGGFMVHPTLIPLLSAHNLDRAGRGPMPVLSPRELEVLQLMGEGKSVKSNAQALGISENTCRGYVKSILAKLDAHSQLEAVAAANRLGLVGARANE